MNTLSEILAKNAALFDASTANDNKVGLTMEIDLGHVPEADTAHIVTPAGRVVASFYGENASIVAREYLSSLEVKKENLTAAQSDPGLIQQLIERGRA